MYVYVEGEGGNAGGMLNIFRKINNLHAKIFHLISVYVVTPQ